MDKQEQSSTSVPVTTVRLQDIATAYGQSAALMAAVEVGLFTAVSEGAGTYEEVARALAIHVTNAERLMVMLCAIGLLEKSEGRHRNAADVERFLVAGKTGYMGPWITFTKPMWNEWGKLGEHIRNTQLSVLGSNREYTTVDARRYHNATYSIGLGAGRRFSRQVDLTGRRRIMDIGGGSGAYCIAAAKAYPGIRAVVLDVPAVCEVARDFIADNGVADRVQAQACDFTQDPFPVDCDVAIMASNLPLYSREMIAMVIRKAHDALLPGGQMHLIGETTNDDRTGPMGPAYWGLREAVSDSLGLGHSESDVIGYFRSAGFADVAVHEFIPGSLSRITGTRSA
ncbi:MAG: methyltransferase domain-containing protein [Burkholderiaceae bacterium]|nr:methyltransferase domain-containing protein [Burkholderiaceae bacterium]MBP7659720.1 methyltransferase domain-containing protein [Burkholderiaceae bacterium]